jgi:hypothetical protein
MPKKGKKKDTVKVPKKIFGIKLSKRRRKDLKSVIGLFETPEAKALLGSTAAGLAAMWANRHENRSESSSRPH